MTKHGAKAIHCRLGLANIVDFSNSFFFLVSPFVSRFLIAGALRLSSPLYLRSFATHSLPCLRACLHINHALLAVVRTEIITIIKRKRDILSEEAAKKKKKETASSHVPVRMLLPPFLISVFSQCLYTTMAVKQGVAH